MTLMLLEKKKRVGLSCGSSYSFNKTIVPFSLADSQKVSPPSCNRVEDTKDYFPPEKKKSKEEVIQEYMDNYRKAERTLIVNFYTGGNAYKKGIMDALYRGANPLTM
ncbi:MAG: hypothetical protein HYR97_05475 [Candidatus Melainabacteria bacterium]|nr:hypothetical protein [Candidatus Melainabacteria bacterium]